MRKIFSSVLFTVVAILVVSVFSIQSEASEYYPLKEGHRLEYIMKMSQLGGDSIEGKTVSTVVAGKKINGREASVIKITDEIQGDSSTSTGFIVESDKGIELIAFQSPGDDSPKLIDKENWEFKYPLEVGKSWTSEENGIFFNAKISYLATDTIEKMGEVVTVPAGTFEKCMKIRTHFNGKIDLGPYGGNLEVTIEGQTWYAPGVGVVKWALLEKSLDPKLGGGEISMELKSYTK
jgi:hypothetical protein